MREVLRRHCTGATALQRCARPRADPWAARGREGERGQHDPTRTAGEADPERKGWPVPAVTIPNAATAPSLKGYLAVPPVGSGPWPGVVVLHEVFGLNDDIRQQADRLA